MAIWDRNFTGGASTGNWVVRLIYNLDSQDTAGNFSHISLYLQVYSTGGLTQTGMWDGRIYVDNVQYARATPTQNVGGGAFQITSWGGDIGHDVNGNCSFLIGDYVNAPVNDAAQANIGPWQMPRIPLAPPVVGLVVDTIKPTTARMGMEIGSFGHGTSAAMHIHYRKLGDASWMQTGDQNDAAGYNYFPVTGLKPNTTYQYFGRAWNNNGDQSDGAISSFKTQSVAGLAPLLMGLI